jgi:hypothetical protein
LNSGYDRAFHKAHALYTWKRNSKSRPDRSLLFRYASTTSYPLNIHASPHPDFWVADTCEVGVKNLARGA